MSLLARQSTALELAIGPVLDADGVAVTNCVVGDFKIKKTTGNFAALNGSATLTHVSAGVYDLVLTTSDTDTVGLCCVAIDDTTNACASVYLQVVEEAIYDIFFAASATGAVPVASIANNAITAAAIATGAIDADAIADNAIDAGAIAADAITAAKIADGAIDAATFATGAITAAAIAADAIGASELAADAVTEIQSGLATTTHVQEVEDKVDILDTNVDTLLTRITSTLFTGITSLAEWLGLMAGKQTGNTTARTEIRATGAGSGTYSETTDSLEAVRDRGDAAWTTATGFSTHSASDVWAVGTRTLTAIDEDNTTLDLDATIRGAVGLASANLDTQIGDLPTNSELTTALAGADDATLSAISALDSKVGTPVGASVSADIADVESKVDDLEGRLTSTRAGYLDNLSAGAVALEATAQSILADTGTDGVVVAAASKTGYRLSSTGVDDVLDEAIGDSTITMRQALKLAVATLAGKLSGAATTTVTIRNAADDTNVVVATVDADGNRSAVTLSL